MGVELEAIKNSVALMKRMCRLQSQVVWKEWRCSVKEQHGRRLQAKLDTLQVLCVTIAGHVAWCLFCLKLSFMRLALRPIGHITGRHWSSCSSWHVQLPPHVQQ